MIQFLVSLFEVSIAMSLIGLVYMALTPLLRKIITAKGRYYAWLVIVIGLLIPFRFHQKRSAISIDTFFPVLKTTDGHSVAAYETGMLSSLSWSSVLIGLWMSGVVIFIGFHMNRHRRLLKMVGRWSMKADDPQMLHMLHDAKAELQIKQKVALQICPSISSPMLVGFMRPTILLPTEHIPADELSFVFKHELVHFKRRDVWYKAVVLLATALHWFNPFVYILAREISVQCEISCDEAVIQRTGIDNRQKYVETIIGVIRKQTHLQSKLMTHFYSGKSGMKQRVYSIMDTQVKKQGLTMLTIILIATCSTGMMIKISVPNVVIAMEESVREQSNVNKEMITEPFSQKNNNEQEDQANPLLLVDEDEETFEHHEPQLVEGK